MKKNLLILSVVTVALIVIWVFLAMDNKSSEVNSYRSIESMMNENTDSSLVVPVTSASTSVSALPDSDYEILNINAPKGIIRAFVANTDEKLELGLSGRKELPKSQGMVFQFPEPGIYSFWMKDMLIPLDMVWVNQQKAVIGITSNIQPDSYPNTFNPPSDVTYVVELNAGGAQTFGIATGTVLGF